MAGPFSRTSTEDWMAQPWFSFIGNELVSGGSAVSGIGRSRLPAAKIKHVVRTMCIGSLARPTSGGEPGTWRSIVLVGLLKSPLGNSPQDPFCAQVHGQERKLPPRSKFVKQNFIGE